MTRAETMDLLDIFGDSDDVIEFAAGDVIMEEGDEGSVMYVVIEGEVKVLLKDKVVALAGPGEIVGEMALIDSDIRSATVTARSTCKLVPIDLPSFEALLRHVPDFSKHVMNVLANRLQIAYGMIDER